MCAHSDVDKLAPGICVNCNLDSDSFAWAVVAVSALYILAQMVRSWEFFLDLARRML